MSSIVSATPLTLEIKPSRLLALYVLCVYTAAAVVIVMLPLAFWVQCGAWTVLLRCSVMAYRRHVSLRSGHAIMGLKRQADGTWRLRMTSGATHQASLLPDSYLHSALLVLNFRLAGGKRCSAVLVRDSAECASLRRLRVGLMLGVRQLEE